MRKKILKNGNSYAVILPVGYLELLGIDKNEYKNFTVDVVADYSNRQVILKDVQNDGGNTSAEEQPPADDDIPF